MTGPTATAVIASPPLGLNENWRRTRRAACALATLVATTGTAALAASAAGEHPELVALARGLIVGVPVAIGLGMWVREPAERFGPVLAMTGAAWSVTALAESSDELLYTLGRTAGWFVEILMVYLILSFPTGRLATRVDRALVGAMGVVVLALFVPRLFIAAGFQLPSPYTSCSEACPANAFLLLDHQAAFVHAILQPAGALAVIAVMVAVLVRLRERARAASPLLRALFWPVAIVAAARVALLAGGFALREADPQLWIVSATSWALAFAVPAIALGVLLGTLRSRLSAAHALEQLAEWLGGTRDVATLRMAFAEALRDPALEIVFPARGTEGWADAAGRTVAVPEPHGDRTLREVVNRGAVVAGVIHDRALSLDPQLATAGMALAGVALDNQRLAREASTATLEVKRSRARIAASAEQERRRIERDLHDGAQQRLVALRIELELAEDLVRRDAELGATRLHELEHELDETLEDLRSLAHGVFPPLLADRGLSEALAAVARRSPVRVDLALNEVRRYPAEVESAVYFCVVEALQNALKHGAGAHRIAVRVDGGGGELRFSVRDDGAGAGQVTPGVGITNMRDRLATLGGDLEVGSMPRVGTTVRGRLPSSDHGAA